MHARISKIDIDRFQVELTSKTSDLVDKDHKWRLSYDPFYDTIAEEEDKQKEEDKNKNKAKQSMYFRLCNNTTTSALRQVLLAALD